MKTERLIEAVILVSAGVVGALVATGHSRLPISLEGPLPMAEDPAEVIVHRQVVLVFIGDLNCPYTSSPRYRDLLAQVQAELNRQVDNGRADSYFSTAVLVSADPIAGLRYLRDAGSWNEISLGGGWKNSFVHRFIADVGSQLVVPQIVVYEREVIQGGSMIITTNESRLYRVQGSAILEHLVEGSQWWRLLPDRPEM